MPPLPRREAARIPSPEAQRMADPPPTQTQQAVTELLAKAHGGDPQVTDELFPIVYDELRAIAARYLSSESNAQTLQATALVHEAYIRLVGSAQTPWENRAHFFGAAARAIRRILTDHARARGRIKRGGGQGRAPLDEALLVSPEPGVDLEGLDKALTELARLDPQKARVVELRFFAGLTVEHTALALGISSSTVARDWQFARVWLSHKLEGREA